MSMIENLAASVTITRLQTEELFTRHGVPPRSKLYGLVPCGLGTVWSESLTSYLNRLAWHHHVPPQHRVAQEIVPHLSHGYWRHQLSVLSWSSAMSVNGNGPLAREWASILEDLTRRSDLHFLTFRWWVGDLFPHTLLRKNPAWCPAWYAEWKEKALPIYEPLLWGCQPVTMCVKHCRKLESPCPRCERRQSFIRLQAALDQCTRCNAWLGTSAQALEEPGPEVIEWQRWVIEVLEELRSAVVTSGIPPWEQFFTNLSTSGFARGEHSRLAELAGLARGQLATWLRRSHTPTLERILEFCSVCNVTPLPVLRGDLALLKRIIQEGKPSRPPRSRRLYRPVDRQRCLERIQAILDGREEPLGYGSLAQQLGCTQHTLLYHFPQECALLSHQIKEYRRQQAEQRVARIREEIRQAVLALHAQGIYPSHRKVIDLLANPKLLRHPEARATRRVLCRELGWD